MKGKILGFIVTALIILGVVAIGFRIPAIKKVMLGSSAA